MKKLNEYIIEKLHISSKRKIKIYNYYPKNKEEFQKIVNDKIENSKVGDIDLNDINLDNLSDMNSLFMGIPLKKVDMTMWDVSHVKDMHDMFCGCVSLECDLSS